MNRIQLLLICLFILNGSCASFAQNAASLISQGRAQLRLQTPAGLAQADDLFGQAVTASPNNLEANFLKAATTLIREQSSAQFQAQLTGFGVQIVNNDIYNYDYLPPYDSNGALKPNPGVFTTSALTYLNSKSSLIDAALTNLGRFGNSTTNNFNILLPSNETTLSDVRVDYGDVMMVRAIMKCARAFLAMMNSYNVSVEYAKLALLEERDPPNVLEFLQTFPDLFKLSSTNQRATARTLLLSANADFQIAHNFINNRPENLSGIPNLVEYENTEDVSQLATILAGIASSLNSKTTYSFSDYGVGLRINPDALFSSATPPRNLISSNSSVFEYGLPLRSAWQDTTIGGFIAEGSNSLFDALESNVRQSRLSLRLLDLAKIPVRRGAIRAWGSNASAQIGLPPGLSDVVQIAAGGNHSLALRANGTVSVWGGNDYGQSTLPPLLSTVAGSGSWGAQDGPAQAASFSYVTGLDVDSAGNIYLADNYNNKVRKITPGGLVSTLAGSGDWGSQDGQGNLASFSNPQDVAVDSFGNMYVADTNNNKIRKITPGGLVSTLAGSGDWGSQDGQGNLASFSNPRGIAVDNSGNIYVAEYYKVRKITASGFVSTVAGTGWWGFQDGSATESSFAGLQDLALDSFGNIYLADTYNHRVRKISSAGVVTTLAGSGNDGIQDGLGSNASFSYIRGITIDANGQIYVADSNRLRTIKPNGFVESVNMEVSYFHSIEFNGGNILGFQDNQILKFNPEIRGLANVNQVSAGENHSLALKNDGMVFGWGKNDSGQCDFLPWLDAFSGYNVPIVQISAGGNHSLALDANGIVRSSGEIPPDSAIPSSMVGAVQVAAGGNHSVALTAQGSVVAWGSNDLGQSSVPSILMQASLGSNSKGISADASGNLYLADSGNNLIRKISSNGTVTTLAGSGKWDSEDGFGKNASFSSPNGIAIDSSGEIYVSDGNKIRRVTPAGMVTTFAGSGSWGSEDGFKDSASFSDPRGLAIDNSGNIYVADSGNSKIRKISPSGEVTTLAGSGEYGSQDGLGSQASFQYPQGLAVDNSGNVFVADSSNNVIRRITPTGVVSTFAGSSGKSGFKDGPRSTARFSNPTGVAVDPSGVVYVVDSSNNKIRRISTNGTVSTLAGSFFSGWVNGNGTNAWFDRPIGITLQGSNLFVTDNHKIRRLTLAGAVTTFTGSEGTGFSDGPASMAAGNRVVQIAAGGSHSLALTANGTVIAWGDNSLGQSSVPSSLRNVVQIAAGKSHSIAVTANGSVVSWGSSASGLGSIPAGITNPIQAVAGGQHSMVLVASAPAGAPEITVQPAPQLVYLGSNATFSVTALGANLTYQWLLNGAAIQGATSSTYRVVASQKTLGNYTVRVTNPRGNATSMPASLMLRPAAEWTWVNNGPSAPIQSGQSATFSVGSVTGPGSISYQWLKNGVNMAGRTSNTLTFASANLSDGGVYSLRITTSAGNITTESRTLIVLDSSVLVYSMNATGNSTSAATRQSAAFQGFLVRNRSNNDCHIFWMDINKKTYSYELRSDIVEKSTGPFSGSFSVLKSYVAAGSQDDEMLWLSGTDSITDLNPSLRTLAPAAMRGQINSVFHQNGTNIEMIDVNLTLNTSQTLRARTTDGGINGTINRLTNEIKALGYQ